MFVSLSTDDSDADPSVFDKISVVDISMQYAQVRDYFNESIGQMFVYAVPKCMYNITPITCAFQQLDDEYGDVLDDENIPFPIAALKVAAIITSITVGVISIIASVLVALVQRHKARAGILTKVSVYSMQDECIFLFNPPCPISYLPVAPSIIPL